ncbi:hypothetical protein VIGAN_04327800, partial [Vigna angularis var. angularis]
MVIGSAEVLRRHCRCTSFLIIHAEQLLLSSISGHLLLVKPKQFSLNASDQSHCLTMRPVTSLAPSKTLLFPIFSARTVFIFPKSRYGATSLFHGTTPVSRCTTNRDTGDLRSHFFSLSMLHFRSGSTG